MDFYRDNKPAASKYTMEIKWCKSSQKYLVFLPEFIKICQPVAEGNSYEEAARNATKVLERLIKSKSKTRIVSQIL